VTPKKRARRKSPRVRRETSAGGIVLRVLDGRRLYLLICDKYGNWGFPKGHLEKGEGPLAAALREVSEETGLDDVTVRGPVSEISWMFNWKGTLIKKNCHFFLMEAGSAKTTPQTDEGITECRWTDFDDALELLRYDNARQVLRDADALASGASVGS
jgi:8-oxo-dGTP pyrophosphatase MutT (NUDIX family)